MSPPDVEVRGTIAVVGALPAAALPLGASSTLQLIQVTDLMVLDELAHRGRLTAVVWASREGDSVAASEVASALAATWIPLIVCIRADPPGLRSLLACARYPGPLHAAVWEGGIVSRVLSFACRYPLLRPSAVEVLAHLLPVVRDSLRCAFLAAVCCAPWNVSVSVFLRACGYAQKERTLRSRLKSAGWPSPFGLLGLCLGVHTAHWAEVCGGTLTELAAVGGWQTETSFRNHLRHATGKSPLMWKRMGFRSALALAWGRLSGRLDVRAGHSGQADQGPWRSFGGPGLPEVALYAAENDALP